MYVQEEHVIELTEGFMVVQPPRCMRSGPDRSVILIGSEDNGEWKPWKDTIVSRLEDKTSDEGFNLVVFDPERKEWETNWQHMTEGSRYKSQVRWELEHMEEVDVVVLYLGKGISSSMAMMELGLLARTNRLVLFCPDDEFGSKNVKIFCERYEVTRVEKLDALLAEVEGRLFGKQESVEAQGERDTEDDWRDRRVRFYSSKIQGEDGKTWWSRGVNKWVNEKVHERMRLERISTGVDGRVFS
jgi:hypothetical protein